MIAYQPISLWTDMSKSIRSIAAAGLLAMSSAGAWSATPEIGDAVMVKKDVTASIAADTRKVEKGAKLHQEEVIETGKDASTEIVFLDKTKLAVGSSAKIVLDKFVYDASANPGSISINLTKGAFRFITGASPKAAYEIKTPTASMGVRGTVFDVYVADNGETAVLLHEGGVDVCPTPGSCKRHDKVGRLVHVNLNRILSEPLKWDGSIIKGIAVATAFPFVGKKLVIDPIRRLSRSALSVGTAPGRIIRDPVKKLRGVGRILRKPRLPF